MYNLQYFGVGIELPGHLKTVQIGENEKKFEMYTCTDIQSFVNFAFFSLSFKTTIQYYSYFMKGMHPGLNGNFSGLPQNLD